MGCDIHSYAERRGENGWYEVETPREPFEWRSYSVFGFLADVRNYSAVKPIAEARGLPEDVSVAVREAFDGRAIHHLSWLSVEELQAFDYEQQMEDRRVMRNGHGGSTCDPGEGVAMTFRDFLGESFFEDLAMLQQVGAERIVFGFDS